MNRLRFENSVKSKLAAAIESDSQTEIAIEGPELFPVLEEGDFYFVTVVEGSVPNEVVEVMKVTGQSGELLTVARGQDGTDARSFNVTARIEMRVNAGIMRHLIDERLALEARTIEADAVLQANIDEQAANVGGATAQIVSSAIRTLLVDETQAITAGSSVVFSHIADPALLRSIFVEKYVDGQTTPVVLEGADAELGALQVGHDADGHADRLLHFPNCGQSCQMVGMIPMTEIQTEQVRASGMQPGNGLQVRTGRSQSGDYFR